MVRTNLQYTVYFFNFRFAVKQMQWKLVFKILSSTEQIQVNRVTERHYSYLSKLRGDSYTSIFKPCGASNSCVLHDCKAQGETFCHKLKTSSTLTEKKTHCQTCQQQLLGRCENDASLGLDVSRKASVTALHHGGRKTASVTKWHIEDRL